jgi:hypothetical protein
MNQTSSNSKWITKVKINDNECLRFVFVGVLTQKQSLEACAEWKEIFNLDRGKKYTMIFNSIKMDNYEPLARAVFQKAIKELNSQIVKLWVVTDSKLISGGAGVMGMFTSFSIKCVPSEEQITP